MAAVMKTFGFLNKCPKRGVIIDSSEPDQIGEYKTLKPEFGNQHYEFEEEIDPAFPEPLMKEIQATIFVDSNHGHDKVIEKYINGMIGLLGSTLVSWSAKRQSSAMTVTFGVEFISLKKAVEKVIVYRYHCRVFGKRVSKPTIMHEDNMAVFVNSAEPGSMLQHECTSLSCHFCRENCADEVVQIRHVKSKSNLADGVTKGLDSSDFNNFSCH